MFLDATTKSLELITSTAQQIDYAVDYVSHTSSGATPTAGEGSVSSATTTTILAAPAASTQYQPMFISFRNVGSSANTLTVQKDVSGTNRIMSPAVTLQAGEALAWSREGGWQVRDATGRVKVANSYPGRTSSLLLGGLNHNAALTGVKTITSGSSFAIYVGKAPRSLSSISIRYRVTTAAATITWAELAIAKGAINIGGNPNLTVVGFTDVAAIVNSTGQKTTAVNVSAGQSIDEGDDLWFIFGNAATTALVVRALTIADDLQVGVQASVASRPSTIVGTGTAFTIEGATTLGPWAVGVV